ncbi:MAG: DMT family transporter, partial [Chloroflexota bacterium]|nr:DMT family transporter [Chloroflexota bacterium]
MNEQKTAPQANSVLRLIKLVAKPFRENRTKGIYYALASAFFFGMSPIFGKKAILVGVPPLAVVALRTILATLLLFGVIVIYKREYLFIYPAGILGCVMAGWTNGLGSLFYYSALGRLNAGTGQLLYSLYPLFVAIWMILDGTKPSKLTLVRLSLAIPAAVLLTQANAGNIDFIGVFEMLVAAALYALHIPINQKVLYEMPAPTVTFYTLVAMSALVVPTFLFSGEGSFPTTLTAWGPLIGLTLVTFSSRLTLFLGVKNIGGMQTALLGLSELLITLVFAHFWLKEYLSPYQWAGAALLTISLILVGWDKKSAQPKQRPGGWLSWLSAPRVSGDVP